MLALLDAAVGVAHHLVTGLTSLLTPTVGGAATVAAIVAFTLGVRLAVLPLSYAAARGARARAALAPKVRELQRRHRRDPLRLHRATTDLYRAHGVSPFTGLLPALVQAPVFAVTYRLFVSQTVAGHANLLLTHTVLGVPLGGTLASGSLLVPHVLVYAGLFVLLLAVAVWSSRLARRNVAADTPPAVARIAPLLPYATVLVAAFVPLAAAVYLLVSTAWTTLERATFGRVAVGPAGG